ncbi:DUF1272 domain-containing protein [Rhodococcus sp. NPDC060086]|uniref:DUF1272 domain-containing protein n=1 Tax=Rhodococcus sp. NPDC060086 TaxID=3347055 RepID=UPI003660907A
MKSRCELCRAPLAGDASAWICSYECTYCPGCHSGLKACPNCSGELVPRPRRTTGITEIARRTPARIRRQLARKTLSPGHNLPS